MPPYEYQLGILKTYGLMEKEIANLKEAFQRLTISTSKMVEHDDPEAEFWD